MEPIDFVAAMDLAIKDIKREYDEAFGAFINANDNQRDYFEGKHDGLALAIDFIHKHLTEAAKRD